MPTMSVDQVRMEIQNKPSLFTPNSATAFIKKQILCYNQAVSLSRLNKVQLVFLEPKTHK